jgi:hypothetical protein
VKLRLRLPIDSPLPDHPARRAAVIVAIVAGGIVAVLVPVFFAVMLLELVRG